ncbi:MAG: hypothetical protein KF819_24330 [Labilithrix sp.]|nr:hypothetical protein [Labilithrix sp.]
MAEASHVWVCPRGPGPLVMVRKALLASWRGVNASGTDRSDYARACGAGEIGAIEVKGGTVLVFGDDPLRTTWIARPRGGVLVRWVTAKDEAGALAALDAGADSTWMPTGCTFSTAGGEHQLFDAAEVGAEPSDERVKLELLAGEYDIATAVLDRGDATVIAYRFLWRPPARR